MADAVTTKKIHEGRRNVVYHFTNLSDGTGESAAQKVDVSGLSGVDTVGGAPSYLAIKKVEGYTEGMSVTVLADATTDEVLLQLQGQVEMFFDPPLNPDSSATGFTGDILFTTVGATAGDSYGLTVHFVKKQ